MLKCSKGLSRGLKEEPNPNASIRIREFWVLPRPGISEFTQFLEGASDGEVQEEKNAGRTEATIYR